ncbi:MAG TPA: glycosyltransferase family 4 protein [Candidatus Acidoferrales bacterium]|nr:glycosyltransferase family 4 protein [Candidatus Acidoferrales bacterium]
MRILLLTDAFPPEVRSSSHLMYELAEDLAGRGHEVTVVSCEPRYNLAFNAEPAMKPEAFDVIRVRTAAIHNVSHWRRGLGQLYLPLAFYRAARRLPRQDAVLVYSPPLTLGLAAHWLARRWQAAFVLNVQDLFPQNAIDLGALRNPLLIAFFRRLEQYVYRHADAVSVHSAGNAAWLRAARVPEGKLHIIPNWVDLEPYAAAPRGAANRFRRQLELGEKFVVLFAGVMGYAQDMETMVDAAALLRDEPRIVFLLVGDGSERPGVERRVAAPGLENVRLLPFVSREDYPALVAASDVGLVTLKKSMKTPVVPSKLATYMAAARPVVASLNPESDACTLVREAGCGLLVAPGDAAAMASAIRSLLEQPQNAAELGARGRAYALAHLARPVCTAQYDALLRRMARG